MNTNSSSCEKKTYDDLSSPMKLGLQAQNQITESNQETVRFQVVCDMVLNKQT